MTSRMFQKSYFGVSGNPYNMFLASLILHLIVIAAVLMSVPGSSRPLTFGAAYSVALVGPEIMRRPQDAPSIKDMVQSSSSEPDQPFILKRDTSKASTAPLIKKDETHKKDIEKAISAIREKDLSRVDTSAVSRPATASPPSGPPSRSSENQPRTSDYSRFIWPQIKRNWVLPASLLPKDNVTAIIEVRIAQSGALEYIGFEKRSGNTYFDESAMRAVKKSAPFPPLTGWATGRSIEIGIRFHSAELR
jgi:TonB family protein